MSGRVTVLTDDRGQWVQSARLTPAAPSYQIGVDCGANGSLVLYVDGRQIARATDADYTGGAVGLFVQTGAGAILALAVLTKANLALVVPLSLVWIAVCAPGTPARRLQHAVWVLLGVTLVLGPWIMRTRQTPPVPCSGSA